MSNVSDEQLTVMGIHNQKVRVLSNASGCCDNVNRGVNCIWAFTAEQLLRKV
jgi:hypothetical protein